MQRNERNAKDRVSMYTAETGALQEIVDRSRRIVFFGGAGVSTASGIPDFRSAEGLYAEPGNCLPRA